jgi:DNA-binding NarL/FixJ family response regulator
VHLPGGTGLAAVPRIRRSAPETRVLLLTMDDDPDTVLQAVELGVDGYLVKGAGQEEILRAVRAVHDGQLILGRSVHRPRPGTGRSTAPFPQLAAREREMLDLVAAGLSNAGIADRLALSPKTVANYLTSVFAKLGVADRRQAIIAARDAGLGRGGTP